MAKIIYNIDNIACVNDTTFKGIIVDGWAFCDNGQPVNINVSNSSCFLWYRRERQDVYDAYKEYPHSLYAGFHLEYQISSADASIEYIVSLSTLNINEEIKIDLQKYCSNLNSLVNSDMSYFSARITDNICYRIENFWYDKVNDVLLISGWAYGNKSTDSMHLIKPEGELIRVSRQDVKEYFEEKNLNAMCGYEIRIPYKTTAEYVFLTIGENDFYININWKLLKSVCRHNDTAANHSLKDFFTDKSNELKALWRYGKVGASYKKREYEIFLEESNLNRSTYQYIEEEIPENWVKIQKKQPQINIIVPIKNTNAILSMLNDMLANLASQSYNNFIVTFCGCKDDLDLLPLMSMATTKVICDSSLDKSSCIWNTICETSSPYFTIIEPEDVLSKYYLANFVEALNLHAGKYIYYSDYDVCHKENILFPIRRNGNLAYENNSKMLISSLIDSKYAQKYGTYEAFTTSIRQLIPEKMQHLNRIYYHSNAVTNQWKDSKSKIIAFYLPQYHENPENNEWWGKGFTEWSNVKRAYPMFEGHNQPRIPGELGYYDLVEDRTVQHKQVDLALQHDIYGFCFYYYWFKGKRLLKKPVDQYLEDHSLNLPFCICWANETWSRRWDGAEKEILIQQVHNEQTDKEFINDIIPILKDERYIKVDGKPLILIYRIELFPRPAKTITLWRKICQEAGISDIHVALVQSFGMVDHRMYGADSSVEFPPHKIVGGTINDRVLDEEMAKEYTGNIYSYKEIVHNQMLIQKRDYNLWPGCMLGWDNTARRLKAANVFHEFSPELYREWLIKNHTYTQLYNDEHYMFVNAWNEWAEGTYLEPDQKYGRLMLEISKEVVNYK